MEITKSQFRKVVLHYRRLVDKAVYLNRNELLCEQVESFLQAINFRKMHTFLAIKRNHEPDLSELYPTLWDTEKELVISSTDFETRQMRHYHFKDTTKLETNHLGIPEPVGADEVSIADLDLIFVPLLITDKEGSRIGYGGGYYDSLLKETKAIKIGLSLSNPVDKIMQTDKWDIPLNFLITPYKIYRYG